jgi:hypothetical protein
MIPTNELLSARYPNLHSAARYVFIVTYGRSGSTLLQHILNRIPGYCIRGENANVLPYFAQAVAAVQKSEPMSGLRWKGEATGPDHPWYGAERIDPLHLGRALADLFVRDVLNPPAGCRVLGFKEIRYHAVDGDRMAPFRFMRDTFPNMRFIINTRSHASTAQSGWWKTVPTDSVMRQLSEAEDLFDRVAATFPKVSLKMHYDDYSKRPEALERLFAFLEEPFDLEDIRDVLGTRLTHTGVRQEGT